jgi:predicted RND superfamily exporter protein
MFVATLWGPVVTVGLLPLLPFHVNFVTSVFAAVVVGVAGDNAIQYWFAARRRPLEEGIDQRSEGSLQMGLCMVVGTAPLFLSVFTPPRVLGLLLAASFLLMTLGDLFLLRGLLAWKERRAS